MEWLWTAALVPFLLCGLMCLGSIALAAVGLRRGRSRNGRRDREPDRDPADQAPLVR